MFYWRVKLNLSKMMKSKDKAVTVLTKGVEFLLKKNKESQKYPCMS